jgi:hypothetical protein
LAPINIVAFCRMLQGHFTYFGISGNSQRLAAVLHQARRLWRKWLSRWWFFAQGAKRERWAGREAKRS